MRLSFGSCKFSTAVLNHVGLGALSELWSLSRNMCIYITVCMVELAAGSPFHEPQAKNLECLPIVENVIWIKLGHELGVSDCYLLDS